MPAGAVVRFDPGTTSSVGLVPFGGRRVVVGFAGLVDGPLDAPGAVEDALERARACGFADTGAVDRHGPGGHDGAVGRRIGALQDRDPAGPDGRRSGGRG